MPDIASLQGGKIYFGSFFQGIQFLAAWPGHHDGGIVGGGDYSHRGRQEAERRKGTRDKR
jgi:hypothetical protein